MPSSSRGPGLAATALLFFSPAVVLAANPNFSNVPHGRCPNGLKCHHGGVCAVGDKDYTTDHPVPSADLPWLEELNVNGEHCTDCHEGYGGVDCGRKYQVCDAGDPDAPTCFNGSTCWKKGIGSNGRYEYMCDCTQAGHDGVKYAGKFCQHVQEETCDESMFCTNGGKCTSVASAFGGHAHYECECPSHRAGTHCEFLAEEGFSDCRLDCERGVCAKGFKSYDDLVGTGPFPAKLVFDIISSGGEHCVCPDGYTGLRCEIEVDKCGDAKYCYNGATCSYDRSGNPVCDCNSAHTDETSFAGLGCEHESTTFCTPGMDQDQKDAFCTNHGRCITDPDAAHRGCECEEGWSGDLCEIEGDVEPVCDLNCKNGGSCRLGVKGYKDAYDDLNLAVHAKKQQDGMYCSCPEGFTGLQCETDVSHCHNDEHESEHFCLNGVPCDPTNANSVMKKYSCQCDEGHDEISQMLAGRFCEYAVTEFCAKDTARHSHSFCTNGGKCKQYNDHDDTEHHGCCCPEGYEGEFCQLPEGTLDGSKPVTWSPLKECQREKTPAQNDVVYPVAPNKEYDTWNAWPHGGWEAVHDTPTTAQETPVNHKISASKEAKEEAKEEAMEEAVLTSTEPEESPDKSNAGGIVSGVLLSLLVVGGVVGVAYHKRSMKQDPHQFESNWWEGHNTQWWKGDSDVESRDTNIAPRPSPSVSSALRKTWSYPEEHALSNDEMDGKREYSKDHGELHDVMI
ncbi:hypothetical protein ACHAXT_009422 [Thalassiosira profunda]